VIEEDAPGLQKPISHREVLQEVSPPNMLKHADARDFVEGERAGNSAIVLELDGATLGHIARLIRWAAVLACCSLSVIP